jgi:hypothetical protein
MGSAAGISTLGFSDKRTQSAMRGKNPENFNVIITGRMMREPNRLIYVHTVARRSTPFLTKALFPRLRLAACEDGQRSVLCCVVPDPITQASPDQERGGTRIDEHDGWRVAIDLLNPSNLTNNPFSGDGNPDFFANRNGQNLIALGFWPSLHEHAPEDEIKRAEKNRDTHYRYLARESQRLAARSKKDLDEFLMTYPDTHMALDALNIKTDWHSPSTVTATCPNCGDDVKQGLAFHKSSVTDRLCVIDPERAFKAKAITAAERDELLEDDSEGPEDKKRRKSRMQPVL